MIKEKEEKEIIKELYNRVREDKKEEAKVYYNELLFMSDTLTNLKNQIKEKGAVEHFVNGKQEFLRVNPAFTSYNKLSKTYEAFLKDLFNLIEYEEKEELDDFDLDDL